MVKLLETINNGFYTYEVGHECSVVCILTNSLDNNETRYLVDNHIFDLYEQDYNSPFIAKESQLKNNDILLQSDF